MHMIMRQAKFAKEVSRLLDEAADAGTIADEDRYLTSAEAGVVYSWCDDEMEPADCADELIRQRMRNLVGRFVSNAKMGKGRVLEVDAAGRLLVHQTNGETKMWDARGTAVLEKRAAGAGR